ncbi:hypothetical protein [Undibacterium sp. RuTC16W]|uniref:hypothetical protein n=1 Tax=Undibacterium sp. RuTC16W TaxID=3413048 RepID=UPI003BF09C49
MNSLATQQRSFYCHLPSWLVGVISAALLLHGPIAQLPHYHEFADQSVWCGLSHAADVLSNGGFALVALWGMWRLWPVRTHPAIKAGWCAYRLFLVSLFLTAFGSGFYHLAPDNARLLWDRLPIALAFAGLLAAVRAETVVTASIDTVRQRRDVIGFVMFAVISVAWWFFTDRQGAGDLRFYLLLQGLPLILIPLWQTLYGAASADRIAFAAALAVYVLAKLAEIHDHELAHALHAISGHTLKHLLATLAAAILVRRLVMRTRVLANAGSSATSATSVF